MTRIDDTLNAILSPAMQQGYPPLQAGGSVTTQAGGANNDVFSFLSLLTSWPMPDGLNAIDNADSALDADFPDDGTENTAALASSQPSSGSGTASSAGNTSVQKTNALPVSVLPGWLNLHLPTLASQQSGSKSGNDSKLLDSAFKTSLTDQKQINPILLQDLSLNLNQVAQSMQAWAILLPIQFQASDAVSVNGLTGGSSGKLDPQFEASLKSAAQTGQPVRVDLDDQSAVIFKILNGKVSAAFLTSDQGMALYLSQQLTLLRKQLADQNLPVDSLGYLFQSDTREDSQNKQHQPFGGGE